MTTNSDFAGATWRKSSRSADIGQCVELARSGSVFGVRDSKNATGSVITVTTEQGLAFLRCVKGDRLSGRS